jgi:aminopeptidase N
MALVLADCRRFVDIEPRLDDSIKASVRKLIAEQYGRLGWEEKSDESNHDTKLRASIIGLGVYSEHPEIVDEALRRFEDYKKSPDAVSGELRGVIFGAAIRQAAPDAFKYLLELESTTGDVHLKEDTMGALTGTKSEEEAGVLLARLQDPEKVRAQDVDHWLVYLLRNRYTREVAWKWFRENWDWIEKTFKNDQTYDAFPRYAASAFSTREALKEYKAFFESKTDQPPLARNIAMGIEEIENRVDWLERDVDAIKLFFVL